MVEGMGRAARRFALVVIGLVAAAQAGAAGTVSGTVTAADSGVPLAEIEVSLYAPTSGEWVLETFTETGEQGTYAFDDVADGSYRLLFRDWSQAYAFEYSGGASSLDEAADVVVAGAAVAVEADLDPAGRIAGTFTGVDDGAVGQGFVAVFRDHVPLGDVLFIQQLDAGEVQFDVGGLPSGQYIARFSGQVGGEGFAEFYDNVPDAGLATPIDVTAGQATELDIVLGEQSGLDIAGAVSGPQGATLADIEVSLYRRVNGDWQHRDYQSSGADGGYRFEDVDPGTFRLLFRDWSQEYAFEYWPDAAAIGDAQDIVIDNASVTADATLEAAGRISGRIEDPAGRPLSNPLVAVFPAGDPAADVLFVAQPDGAGYDIGGLPGGDYVVRFTGQQSSNRSYREYYDDAAERADATPVAVTAGATTTNIDGVLGLGPGGTVSGRLRDTYDRPLDIARVTALRPDGEQWVEVNSATALYQDDDRDYRLDVPAGEYRLRFEGGSFTAPGGALLTEYYDDRQAIDGAVDIAVAVDESVTGVDAALGNFAQGSIAGQVAAASGAALEGIEVIAFDRRFRQLYDQVAVTGPGGEFTVEGLRPGTYYLRFYDPLGDYASVYYPSADSPGDADTVAVDGAVAGVDVTLSAAGADAPGSIAGTVTDDAGAPVRGVRVSALEAPCDFSAGFPNCELAATARTASDGGYRLRDLASGDYLLRFAGEGEAFVREYYEDAADAAGATAVTVTAPAPTAGIDAALTPAGAVSGRVTNPFGQAFEILGVNAYQQVDGEWQSVGSTAELNDADYRIGGLPAGSYRVGFSGGSIFGDSETEFYDDAATIDDGQDVAVSAGATTAGIDAVLGTPPPGAIAGTVVDGAGEPVAGITVRLEDSRGIETAETLTGGDGGYRFAPLFDGVYFVAFEDTGGTLPGEYYDDIAAADRATPVTVDGGEVTGVDAALDGANSEYGGGAISGTVTAAGGTLAGVRVSCRPVGDGWFDLPCFGTTDAQGRYQIGGRLTAGDYRVRFTDPGGDYAREYYDDRRFRLDADPVPVTLGQASGGIDAALAEGAAVSGTVTREGGGFYEITAVSLLQYDADAGQWRQAGRSVELNNGAYSITGVPAGTYRVSFVGTSSGGGLNADQEFYDDVAEIDNADPVTLAAGATLTDIDAILGDLPESTVANPNFDQGLDGWNLAAPDAAGHDPADAFDDAGSGSLRLDAATPNEASQCMPVAGGVLQSIAGWLRVEDAAGGGPRVEVRLTSFPQSGCAGGALDDRAVAVQSGDDGPGWTAFGGEVELPDGTASARISLAVDPAGAGSAQVHIDRVSLRAVPPVVFRDGFE